MERRHGAGAGGKWKVVVVDFELDGGQCPQHTPDNAL